MMAYNFYQQNNTVNWVQGEAAARSYPVAPNSSVFLMDYDGDRFYIKSADLSGMPTFRAFEFREIAHGAAGQEKAPTDGYEHQFVTKDEFEGLKRIVEGLAEAKKDEQSV